MKLANDSLVLDSAKLKKVSELVRLGEVPQFRHPDSRYMLTANSSFHCAKNAVEFLKGKRKKKNDVARASSIRVINAVLEALEGDIDRL